MDLSLIDYMFSLSPADRLRQVEQLAEFSCRRGGHGGSMIQFRESLKRLRDHEIEFVVIGGVAAAALQGSPLVTVDVDGARP